MVPLIRSGDRLTGLNRHFFAFLFLALTSSLPAQTAFVCTTTSTNQQVRAEGLTEQTGSLLLNCSGGTAGQTITSNLTATFPAAITNRVNAAGTPDISLSLDSGSGFAAAGLAPVLLAPNTVAVNGISVTVPASRALTIKLQNVRLAVATLPANQPVTASLSATSLPVTNATAIVATPFPGLLSNSSNTAITCAGSPLPATLDLASLFAAGTRFTSLRFTEGFGTAFVAKDALSDTGTRIVVTYAGFPAGARVFVPDYVAGNSATQPTLGGDLGGKPSAGIYTPGVTGSLLLARVVGAGATGAGGTPYGVAAQFSGPTQLGTVSEVPLTNGGGVVVYEVIDANPAAQESAQFPTFVGLAANPPITAASASLTLGPVSTVAVGTAGDPVPRFRAVTPPNDCQFLGDCGANYFPMLSVNGAPITFRSPLNGLQQTNFLQVNNAGGGLLSYTATVSYQSGNGFVFLEPAQGTGNATIRVILNAAGLTPGTYQASILIAAGAAGSRTIPVTLTVDAPAAPSVTVSSVTNAATLTAGPLVAGSLGTIKGANLAGTAVSVSLDTLPAPIFYKSATQINFQVPSALAGKTSVQLVVTVDGAASQGQPVPLVSSSPGIFGVLNQDGTLNAAGSPAGPGTVLQIFTTGLALDASQVSVSAGLATGLVPLYAGAAPGLPGVQQVNVAIPGGNSVSVCNEHSGLRSCSPAFPIAVR